MPGKSMSVRKEMLYSKKPKMGSCDMNPHKTMMAKKPKKGK